MVTIKYIGKIIYVLMYMNKCKLIFDYLKYIGKIIYELLHMDIRKIKKKDYKIVYSRVIDDNMETYLYGYDIINKIGIKNLNPYLNGIICRHKIRKYNKDIILTLKLIAKRKNKYICKYLFDIIIDIIIKDILMDEIMTNNHISIYDKETMKFELCILIFL